ncbi:MAG TPA: response regulator transcription factor [Gemmatimonadaceae bacterium]|nr:response regulator transcription factor [Gemmatimonadaceae bacterium]
MTRYDERAPVWVVEDSALYRDAIGEILDESERMRCVHAFADGEAALAELARRRELPRMVLMDIALPGMGGIEATRHFRRHNAAIPVVMLTVHQSTDRIFQAICAGASGYLLKSAPREEIVRGLEDVLDGGGAMDRQIARRVLEMFNHLAAPRADYRLSEREREILHLLVDGATKQGIADRLALSPHTVDAHVRSIYTKLHVHNRGGAVAKAVRENLL